MAFDKVIDSTALDADLTDIANAIRIKAGNTDTLNFPNDFISSINNLDNKDDYLATVMNREITELVNDKIIYLPSDFQHSNKNLTKVDLPLVTAIKSGTFNFCNNLSSVNFPAVETIDSSCFELCNSLKELYFPSLKNTTGWGYIFNACLNIEKVVLPVFTGTIKATTFIGCEKLVTLVLGADTVCTLENIDALHNTPIRKGTGYIYVKKALIDSYKSATNWSTVATQFRAIEDYPDICG